MYKPVYAPFAVTYHGEWVEPETAAQEDYDILFCEFCRLKISVVIDELTGVNSFVHARAMEGAASLCQTRAHAEILPEHWLLKLLEQGEGDLTVLARRYEWDMDALWQDLLGWLDKQPRSVRHRPQLSENIQMLMQEAWLITSFNGEEQIRSVHLLMALAGKQNLVRCDGLWPLLTLARGQLERMRSLLDAQSDERQEVQREAELAQRQRQGGEVEFVGRPVGAEVKEGELSPALQNALDKFTLDVTASAREGKIDPVFGRDTEIRQMVDILSRRRKNNPILVGEPGVGKTALVEGLALRIAEGNVPECLKTVVLRTLDPGLLQAGAGVKGEFEQRLKNVIDAVQQSPVPILLFIDEAHTIIGAGNQAGGADAANLLKPALARGELRTIAATTWSEYKQYFERDAALERRFQRVLVDEPDDDTACLMLRGLKSRYAEHHHVHITDDAVRAAVTLSRRYLTGRQLPDKAVDLLDTAADNDMDFTDVSVNSPAPAGDVYIENLTLAGVANIAPSWTGDGEDGDAILPEKPGPVLVTRIDNLEMQHGSKLATFPYISGVQFNRLEIKNLSGEGDFYLTTSLADGLSDKIYVSEHATGNFGLMVNDSGREVVTPRNVQLAYINSGDARFNLLNNGEIVEAGVWQYKLYNETENGHTEWFLIGGKPGELSLPETNTNPDTDTDIQPADTDIQPGNNNANTPSPPPVIPQPVLSNSAHAVINIATAPRHILDVETGTLQQRMGNLRRKDGDTGVWARYISDDSRLSDNHYSSFRSNLSGMQVGVDHQTSFLKSAIGMADNIAVSQCAIFLP